MVNHGPASIVDHGLCKWSKTMVDNHGLDERHSTNETIKKKQVTQFKRHVTFISFYSPKVLVIPRNRWLRLNMTEKLFTGTLNHNQNKTKQKLLFHDMQCLEVYVHQY